ncbi:MAG: hypothetical protein JRG73_16440 [Deltaproteobacteria bacterium]|nr:hypothetical protein [Deltaproteobacteria bacterium]
MSGVLDNESNVRFHRATGTGAIAESVTMTDKWRIMQIRLHLSGASAAEDLIVSIDSAVSAVYDAVLVTQAMNGLTDYAYMFGDGSDGQIVDGGDAVNIDYPNSNGRTWGLEVAYRGVGG